MELHKLTMALQRVFGMAADAAPNHDRALVNYLWISRQQSTLDLSNPVCSIGMENIQRAVNNANKYPEADFRIWVDKNLIDEYSLFCLESFISDHTQSRNLTLHDLQDIPSYANDPYFRPPFPDHGTKRAGVHTVYTRADYARILVLDHCIRNCPEKTQIIYSDIDCPDVALPSAQRIMIKHGIVTNDAIDDMGRPIVSHGYIGITPCKRSIRRQFDQLKLDSHIAAHNNMLGTRAFGAFLRELGMPNDMWHDKIGLPNLLPEMHTKVPTISYTPPKISEFLQKRGAPLATAAP